MHRRLLPLAVALFAFPAAARAELVYKCEARGADRMGAQIRFNDSGRNGYVELDDWNGYPPVGIVYANLHETKPEGDLRVFLSELDSHNGYMAELRVPKDFLNLKSFPLTIQVVRKDGSKERARGLSCVSF